MKIWKNRLGVLLITFFLFNVTSIFAATNPKVKIETNLGDIVVELNQQKAPITVANFLKYANGAFYDGTIFHRVVKGFVIQGGGYTPEGIQKPTADPIRNESYNGLNNLTGTIAMARSASPHSATTQFYINTGDHPNLDGKAQKFGYTVFGKVVSGMDVVTAIENVAVSPDLNLGEHRPDDDVIIKRIRVLKKMNKLLQNMIKTNKH